MPTLFAATAMALLVADQVQPLNPLALGLACGDDRRAHPAPGGDAEREPAHGRGEPRRGAHRRAHRPRQPPQAHRRPRGRAGRRPRRVAAHPDPLRPRRLQALQRRLRPPRRRRAARPASATSSPPRSRPYGEAYRLGGDEFCAVVSIIPRELEAFLVDATAALRESGEGFAVESSVRRGRPAARGGLHAARPRGRRPAHVRAQAGPLARAHARAARAPPGRAGRARGGRRRPAGDGRGGARRGRARRRAARRRQGRHARHDPREAAEAHRRSSGSTCASTRWPASAS